MNVAHVLTPLQVELKAFRITEGPAIPKMPSSLDIEPIELTLFNGQTSKPFPQRECHF